MNIAERGTRSVIFVFAYVHSPRVRRRETMVSPRAFQWTPRRVSLRAFLGVSVSSVKREPLAWQFASLAPMDGNARRSARGMTARPPRRDLCLSIAPGSGHGSMPEPAPPCWPHGTVLYTVGENGGPAQYPPLFPFLFSAREHGRTDRNSPADAMRTRTARTSAPERTRHDVKSSLTADRFEVLIR